MDPYTHVLFADYVSTDVFCHFSLDASLKPYMFSGSIFPDIGYFGKNKSFSDVIHNNLPHKFVEKLCFQLKVPEEIAFFWGFVRCEQICKLNCLLCRACRRMVKRYRI